MKITLSIEELDTVVQSLYEVANIIAGHSQMPDLIYEEDLDEYKLAAKLEKRLERAQAARASKEVQHEPSA